LDTASKQAYPVVIIYGLSKMFMIGVRNLKIADSQLVIKYGLII